MDKKEYDRNRYENDKENIKQRASEYRKENKEKILEYRLENRGKAKEYREKNKEKIAKWHKEYNIKNKDITKERVSVYNKTKDGLITRIYGAQRASSKKRGHPMPPYELEELREWIYIQTNFEELYNDWVASGYDRWKRPSTDRLDDSKGYSFDNMQLTTWRDNCDKGAADRSSVVDKFTTDGVYIESYRSIVAAAESIHQAPANISSVIRGETISAGGYLWRYGAIGTTPKNVDSIHIGARAIMKPIFQYTLAGDYMQTHQSAADAGRVLKENPANIISCLNGNRNVAYGYQWKRAKSINDISDNIAGIKTNRKEILKLSLEGVELDKFRSISKAAESVGVKNRVTIRNCLDGKKESAYGFIWKYAY